MLMMFSFYWFQVAFGGEGYLKMLGIQVGGVETDFFSAAEPCLPSFGSLSSLRRNSSSFGSIVLAPQKLVLLQNSVLAPQKLALLRKPVLASQKLALLWRPRFQVACGVEVT
ncbi:hypothetical protein EIKCOROL_00430 [Eikenella corrodens ATCC 23834]|uniref:Uncharacterized protein n=1 Tax=Eikenella corrodens ATCC 23834 TaxID=546274 RepID=C0DSV6_EIKCO|nr:hypothetical protein EIKCOROL_00430 [Eikenella corrodens ATCC 23834]OAM29698.1 hypothetical protein A7P93_06510 [Eikenella corrodens]